MTSHLQKHEKFQNWVDVIRGRPLIGQIVVVVMQTDDHNGVCVCVCVCVRGERERERDRENNN